eukprot:GHUV01002142.1.p1 GENE.GHUV01002142.1~~GHUV01002142.1.p1  ORF type:complete len:469 (+),score=172.40 GHUV01002142.1:158-1564(+)
MSEANKDEAFKCLDIARAALREGNTPRAEKFAQKALKLYRCDQTESMLLQVQVHISEMTRDSSRPTANGTASAADHHSNSSRQHHSSNHHHQNHWQQQQQPSQQHPRGMGGEGPGLRQRHSNQNGSTAGHHHNTRSSSSHAGHSQSRQQQQQQPKEQPEDPSVTPEQRRVVQQILAAKGFYEVLGVSKDASDADIKQAYKKLALRLHPDKNRANHADEAFKLLSKAFSCLSNPDKRAYYDRTGYECAAAAQAAAAQQHNSRRGAAPQYYYTGPDDFDPEEIFNMFFGAGAFGPSSRVFRSHFGGPAYAQQARQQRAQHVPSRDEQQRTAFMGLMQLLPILLIVALTLFSNSQEPVYTLAKDPKYPVEFATSRASVLFYVKEAREFESQYPPNTHKRIMLERQIETDMYERVFQRCQNERMAQHRAYTWGNRETARKMELANCRELTRMNEAMNGFRAYGHPATVGGRI